MHSNLSFQGMIFLLFEKLEAISKIVDHVIRFAGLAG